MDYLNREKLFELWRLKYPEQASGKWVEERPDGTLVPTVKQDRKGVFFLHTAAGPSNTARMRRDGMSAQHWSNIFSGTQSDDVRLSTLYKLARIVGCHPAELLMPTNWLPQQRHGGKNSPSLRPARRR